MVYLGGDPRAADEVSMTGEEIEQAMTSRRSEVEMRRAYAQAAAMVRDLDRRNGRAKIIDWLRSGLPGDIRGGWVTSGPKKVTR